MIALLIRDGIYIGYHETITAEELDEIGHDYVFVDSLPPELQSMPANTIARIVSKEPLEIELISTADPQPSLQQRVEALETESTVTMLGLAQVYEEKETEVTNAMLATAELYELLLDQQAIIAQMQARIEQLEAAANGD